MTTGSHQRHRVATDVAAYPKKNPAALTTPRGYLPIRTTKKGSAMHPTTNPRQTYVSDVSPRVFVIVDHSTGTPFGAVHVDLGTDAFGGVDLDAQELQDLIAELRTAAEVLQANMPAAYWPVS